MNSGFPAEFIQQGGGGGRGRGANNNQGGYQQLQFPQYQHLRQRQDAATLQDQIAQRRVDLLMGKRSFNDYQLYQQLQLVNNQQTRHHHQQQPLSYLQQLQHRQLHQQQQQTLLPSSNLLRSVKQRTSAAAAVNNNNIDLCSSNIMNNNSNCVTRFGVPVYQQTRQQQIPLFNNQNFTQMTPSINNNSFVSSPTFSNNNNANNSGRSGSGKILNTLQELEKHLLEDDDFGVAADTDGDAVSGITNSEWSETFQNLMSTNANTNPNPNPIQNPNPINNNNNNGNNVISPSPTSSTSSCCSTSAPATSSPPLTTAATTAMAATIPTVPAKELITEAATVISDGRHETAMELLSKLEQISNLNGNSEERLSYYMYNALKSRACPAENQKPINELFGREQMSAIYSLYDISPCFKFGLLAANLVMLEAITGAMQEGLKIQIIDFDVGHGAQYVNLLRALAERKTRLPCTGMRITVVETELNSGGVPPSVKDGLVALAERVGIELKYESVTRPIHELTRESLGCVEGEAVVVNFAFKLYRVPDESVSMENLRDELLRRVKGLSPRAVTLVEQDMNGNTAPFVTRVNEARDYYGALFDSFEATLPRDNPDRCRVESGLGRKMVNSVAFEGRERVERAEVFGKWRARMGMAGFELKAISQSVAESMRVKLNSGRGGNPGFTVKEESGGVGFGWMGRSLTVASAWR